MEGTLYLVATPIGNLEDITQRAVRVLGEVDWIACEDTRQTRKLLEHYSIRKPTLTYHEHNEAASTPQLIAKLAEGANIALVSDAGTPLISDPGYRLVSAAIAAGVPVVPIPGASAVVTALAASGLPTDTFCFIGFLPSKRTQRKKLLEGLISHPSTLVFYEGPHRLIETLADLQELFGDRSIVVARELTKLHEEFLRGTAAEILEELKKRTAVKGECTVIVGRPSRETPKETAPSEVKAKVDELVRQGVDRMQAIKTVARELGLPKRTVYSIMEDHS